MFRVLERDPKHFDNTEGVHCVYSVFMFLENKKQLRKELLEIDTLDQLTGRFRRDLYFSFDEENSVMQTFDAGSVNQAEEFMLEHIFEKEDYNDLNDVQKFLYNSLEVIEKR